MRDNNDYYHLLSFYIIPIDSLIADTHHGGRLEVSDGNFLVELPVSLVEFCGM